MNPEDWGWALKDNILWPKKTSQLPAPDCLLNVIFCNCTKGCGPLCTCRRLGLNCTSVYGNCHGQSCLNAEPIEEDSSEKEPVTDTEIQDSDIHPTDFLEQCPDELIREENE